MRDLRLQIEGMSCQHCVASVKEALAEVAGIESAEVDLEGGTALVRSDEAVTPDAMVAAIEEMGFTARLLAES